MLKEGKNLTIIQKYIIFSHYFLKDMHKEILSKEQIELLPLVRQFEREFYLVGGQQ